MNVGPERSELGHPLHRAQDAPAHDEHAQVAPGALRDELLDEQRLVERPHRLECRLDLVHVLAQHHALAVGAADELEHHGRPPDLAHHLGHVGRLAGEHGARERDARGGKQLVGVQLVLARHHGIGAIHHHDAGSRLHVRDDGSCEPGGVAAGTGQERRRRLQALVAIVGLGSLGRDEQVEVGRVQRPQRQAVVLHDLGEPSGGVATRLGGHEREKRERGLHRPAPRAAASTMGAATCCLRERTPGIHCGSVPRPRTPRPASATPVAPQASTQLPS